LIGWSTMPQLYHRKQKWPIALPSPSLPPRPLQIYRKQPLQYLLIAEVMRPAIGIADGRIQLPVRQIKPGRSLVVEIGQRALLEFDFAHPRRIEPYIPLLD